MKVNKPYPNFASVIVFVFLVHSATDSYTQVPLHVDAQSVHTYYISQDGYLYLPIETIDNDTVNTDSNVGVLEYNENDWRTWQQAPTEEAKGSKRILKYDHEKLNTKKWKK